MKALIWPIRIQGETWTAGGRRRRIAAWVEGAGDAKGAIRASVARQPRAWEWEGAAVTGVTPLGQKVTVTLESRHD